MEVTTKSKIELKSKLLSLGSKKKSLLNLIIPVRSEFKMYISFIAFLRIKIQTLKIINGT